MEINSEDVIEKEQLAKDWEEQTNSLIPISMILGVFWAFALWGFWTSGIYAFGLNAFLFSIGMTVFFSGVFQRDTDIAKKDYYWLIPLALISLSFFLYENPFIKFINLLVFPTSIIVFKSISTLQNRDNRVWTYFFVVSRFVLGLAGACSHLTEAKNRIQSWIASRLNIELALIGRILLGVICFSLLSLIIIPLLASADDIFSSRISQVLELLESIASLSFILKLIFSGVVAICLLTFALYWSKPQVDEFPQSTFTIDSLIAGIVVGGLLAVYLLFITVQIERLFLDNLPMDFKSTEALVKSGFWQLFFVSLINVGMFVFLYKKTNNMIQRMLQAFASASLLILASAAQRMSLYVYLYGFSYEKFYALYTVLFCALLLCYFIYVSFSEKKHDPVKFSLSFLLWMYAAVSIFPTEHFILETNLRMAKNEDSRIALYEMRMLSTDVLDSVARHYTLGELSERKSKNSLEENRAWVKWIKKRAAEVERKAWYEQTLPNILSTTSP